MKTGRARSASPRPLSRREAVPLRGEREERSEAGLELGYAWVASEVEDGSKEYHRGGGHHLCRFPDVDFIKREETIREMFTLGKSTNLYSKYPRYTETAQVEPNAKNAA